MAALSVDLGDVVHYLKKTQISHIKTDKVPTKVFDEYVNFADVFLPKLAAKLSRHMRINNHDIKLVNF